MGSMRQEPAANTHSSSATAGARRRVVMSALLLTLPLGKYFGFDEIWDDATAVEGLRQVGEAGQACYWIHHKVAASRVGGAATPEK